MPRPHDRPFKTLVEEDPGGFLHLFGSLPLDAPAQIEVIDCELNLPTLSVDHVYHVRTAQEEWLAHYEVQTRYRSDVPASYSLDLRSLRISMSYRVVRSWEMAPQVILNAGCPNCFLTQKCQAKPRAFIGRLDALVRGRTGFAGTARA